MLKRFIKLSGGNFIKKVSRCGIHVRLKMFKQEDVTGA